MDRWKEFTKHNDIFNTITTGVENLPSERQLSELQSLAMFKKVMNEGLLIVFGVDQVGRIAIGHRNNFVDTKQAFNRLYSATLLSLAMYDDDQKKFIVTLCKALNAAINKYNDDKAVQEQESWIYFLSELWGIPEATVLARIRSKKYPLDVHEKTAWFFDEIK